MLSGFHNVELPCDWTVNRRPTQSSAPNNAADEVDDVKVGATAATAANNDATDMREQPKKAAASSKRKKSVAPTPPESPPHMPQLIDAHPLGPLSARHAAAVVEPIAEPSSGTYNGCTGKKVVAPYSTDSTDASDSTDAGGASDDSQASARRTRR